MRMGDLEPWQLTKIPHALSHGSLFPREIFVRYALFLEIFEKSTHSPESVDFPTYSRKRAKRMIFPL